MNKIVLNVRLTPSQKALLYVASILAIALGALLFLVGLFGKISLPIAVVGFFVLVIGFFGWLYCQPKEKNK